MHTFLSNVRVSLDFDLDDAQLLLAMLRNYQRIRADQANELAVGCPNYLAARDGERDARNMANTVGTAIDERMKEVDAKVQAYVDAGMPPVEPRWSYADPDKVSVSDETLDEMIARIEAEDRARALAEERAMFHPRPYGWTEIVS